MKYLSTALAACLALACNACGSQIPQPTEVSGITPTPISAEPGEAILLVSLEDGSVVKQTISSDADLCFKMITSSTTTCLTQGEPVVDPHSNRIVGFKMIEDHIELVARTN
tara:strand:+ start:7989 stop:8321 length:333 start_codon:yes stop_codon:yes gene_type:complete